jgi:guanine deaminase
MANASVKWMGQAIELAVENVRLQRGGPFGALVVRDDKLIATGVNLVTSINDPTAHAEIMAIRNACRELNSFQLTGCELYTSCEPCPMCLGAIYWARPEGFYFAASRRDAAAHGFDDAFIHQELDRHPAGRTIFSKHLPSDQGFRPFEEWIQNPARIRY